MPMPTQEQFDAAPLYRFIVPEPEVAERDLTAQTVDLGGLEFARTDLDNGGFEYRLENVLVAVGTAVEGDGADGYRVQYLSSDEDMLIHAGDRDEAIARIVRLVDDNVGMQDEVLFHRLREQGVAVDDLVEDYQENEFAGPDYGEPVRCVRDGNRIWRQGDETSLLWHEAKNDAVRCDAEGSILSHAGEPILHQLMGIGPDNVAAAAHISDLLVIREALGDAARIPVTQTRHALHYFDLNSTTQVDTVVSQETLQGYRDGVVPHRGFEADDVEAFPAPIDPTIVEHGRTAERHIADILGEETGLRLHFEEIRQGMPYQNPRIRGDLRRMMSPYLGGFPMEHVETARAPYDPEGYQAFQSFWEQGEIVMEVPPQHSEVQRGYVTEAGHVFRRDGWDALVFADQMGLYAYAFPSPPDCVAKPEEESFAPRM